MSKVNKRFDGYLFVIVLLAAFLNGYQIWLDQYANTYYTTAVGSMLQNFHNFFYVSLDSAGSVTVDKPPVVFWIQTASAYIFGLHGWSVILPQALAGVGSVLLMYILVKPSFGVWAARLSALAFALTPIAVAVSRTNNIDSMLVFTLLVATWLLFKSVRNISIWSLLGAFAVIGIGFNMKMLQAYMILPAFYLFYVITAKINWKKKLGMLSIATVVLLAVSLSWAVIVDSIPEDQRPYIGSSETNSVLELAFGYNGIARLTGNQGGSGAGPINSTSHSANSEATNQSSVNNGKQFSPNNDDGPPPFGNMPQNGDFNSNDAPNDGQGTGMFGKGGNAPQGNENGMFGTGQKGPFRLLQSELSGQASWFIPYVLIASVALLLDMRRKQFTQQHKEVVFWLAWLVPSMVFFSIAGFFHHYYLIMLAPPIAALFGAGTIQMFQHYKEKTSISAWLLPVTVCLSGGFAWYIVHPYDSEIGSGWSISIAITSIIATVFLIVVKMKKMKYKLSALILALLVLFIGPFYWSLTPIVYGGNSMLPQASPSPNSMGMGMGAPMPLNINENIKNGQIQKLPNRNLPSEIKQLGKQNVSFDNKTYTYLKQHQTGEEYLFATVSYQTAAPYIIDKNEKVITMGGFSGNDPVYSVSKIKKLVTSGKVKYFLLSSGGMRGETTDVTKWIEENGEKIPSSEWQTSSNENSTFDHMQGPNQSNTLYKVVLPKEK